MSMTETRQANSLTGPHDAGRGASECPGEDGARWLVPAAWAVMTLVCILFIKEYACNFPAMDDVRWVEQAVGTEPVTLAWLWEPMAEHRMVLPKLVFAYLPRLTGGFLGVKVLNVLCLSFLAAVLLDTCRRLRGRWLTGDAAIPLLVLNLAQAESLLYGSALNLVSTPVLMGLTLRWVVLWSDRPTLRHLFALGLYLIALPITSAAGIAFATVLSPWVGWLAVRECRRGGWHNSLRAGWLALVLIGVGVLNWFSVQGTVIGVHRPFDGSRVGLAFCRVLGVAVGTRDCPAWPALALAVAVTLAVTTAVTARAGLLRAGETFRAAGVLVCLAGGAAVACSIAWGRPYSPDDSRYITLVTYLPLTSLVAIILYAGPRLRFAIRWSWLGVVLVTLPSSVTTGVNFGVFLKNVTTAFQYDMKAGMPMQLVVERNKTVFLDVDPRRILTLLTVLRDAGWKPFHNLPPEMPLREIDVSVPAEASRSLSGASGGVATPGTGPEVALCLPHECRVTGLRVTYRLDTAGEYNWIYVRGGDDGPKAAIPVTNVVGDHTHVVWLNTVANRFTLRMYHPTLNVHVLRVTVLAADDGNSAARERPGINH